jgi:hypothetical protein
VEEGEKIMRLPPNVTPVENTPINRVFFALNHYISTGDHVGEGIAMEAGDSIIFAILHRPREWEDKDNWERLKARVEELIDERFPVAIQDLGWAPGPSGDQQEFRAWGIRVRRSELDAFAGKITEKPGPKGWGSMRTFLERQGLI